MNIRFFTLTAVLMLGVASAAFAQSKTGQGGDDQVVDRSCEVQVALVTDGIQEVRDLIDNILDCHANYQLYKQGEGCVPMDFPDYSIDTVGNEYHLIFEGTKPGQWLPGYNVRGPKGPNGVDADINGCGMGYKGSYIN